MATCVRSGARELHEQCVSLHSQPQGLTLKLITHQERGERRCYRADGARLALVPEAQRQRSAVGVCCGGRGWPTLAAAPPALLSSAPAALAPAHPPVMHTPPQPLQLAGKGAWDRRCQCLISRKVLVAGDCWLGPE